MNKNVTVDRHKYVGASDLPNILGYSIQYGTTPYIWAKIKAGIIPNDFKGNEHTKYGQLMEPIIRDFINSKYMFKFVEDTSTDEKKHLRGNCDGIDRLSEALLEIKTYGSELNIDYYNPQIQMYLEMFNMPECWLVGYKKPEDFYTGTDYDLENEDVYFNCSFDEENIVVHRINRDKEVWGKIYSNICRFQQAVEELKTNNDLTEEAFNSIMYGSDLVVMVDKVNELEQKLIAFKPLQEEYNDFKEKLYQLMVDNDCKSIDRETIKITRVDPSSSTKEVIDEKKLKKEKPKIWEEFKTEKTTNKKGYVLITVRSDKNENNHRG